MPRTRPIKVNTAPEIPKAEDEPITIDLAEEQEQKDVKDPKDKEKEPAIAKEVDDGKEIEIQEEQEVVQEDEEKVALRKQLADLKAAEETRAARERALEAERDEARRQAQQHQVQYQTDLERANLNTILNAIEANKSEADRAQADYESAIADSDHKRAAEAQRRMSRAEAQIGQLEQGKEVLEAQIQMAEARAKEPPRTTDPVEASIARLPDPAKAWLRKNREYMTDQRKNAKIQALHWQVIDEGHDAFSTGYFESLETHLGMREKPKPKTEEVREPEPARRNPPVSAPVTRDVPSVTTGKPASTRVTLSPAEREAAKFSGITEQEYAKQKLRLQQEKAAGHYSESR